ncbi:MAG TPA: hypothetical protein PJ988_22535, partial [Anaerolinea sp.]|nr:hypothetical protein [Anaerolinea sp.]
IVRDTCRLRPGLEGISERIRVVSIVGRFLEHTRIYYFRNGGNEIVLMGSADLMTRNLNQRVEVLYPIEDPALIRHVRDDVLETYLADNLKARIMLPDGSYCRPVPSADQPPVNVQEAFIARRRTLTD